MMKKLFLLSCVVLVIVVIATYFSAMGDAAPAQTYARRIFPIFDHTGPCSENQIGYDMLAHEFYVCKNTGWTVVGSGGGSGGGIGITNFNGLVGATQAFAVGTTGTDFNISSAGSIHTFNIPNASATARGLLNQADWTTFNNKQSVLGFTPENIANKNTINGYAGLSGGKLAAGQMTEILSVVDLTEYNGTSGTGTTALRATINSPASGQLLSWNGTNWINTDPVVTSVFGRTGAVVAQTNDYSAAQVTNAFDKSTSNILTLITTPGAPGVGFLTLWADNTDKILKARDSNGNISTTIRAISCASTDKLRAIGADGVGICAADQTGGGGSGITTLNTLTAATQTFSRTNDTNVTLTITSTTADHNFTLGWAGTLADARVADILSLTQIPNLTTNGFIKTSAGNGTLVVDTNTYLTANQTITLSGNVTGSGTTAITTTIANNSVNGAMIALGADTQGDIMYYNGTDWVRLAAGTAGNVLTTQGAGANPTWGTAGTGDMILASVQTITGAKTFNAGKLIIGTNSGAPTIVANSFYRDTSDGKLYIGRNDGTAWDEIFEAGVSGPVDPTKGGTGITSYTKGDLLAASGASTLVKLAVGPNGQFLKADSTQTSGLIWSAVPYDISSQINGKPAVSLQILRYVAARGINLASSGHACSAATSATAQTDFTIAVNGTSKGTLRFAASGTTCTVVSGATASIAAGDVLTITAPGSQDSTLADISFTLSATLQ